MRINKILINLTLIVVSVVLSTHANAQDVRAQTGGGVMESSVYFEHVLWDGIPIAINLPVDKERIIRFDQRISIKGVSKSISAQDMSVINNDGYLYIKPRRTFGPERVAITLEQSKRIILIDLSAKTNAPDEPIAVIVKASEQNSAKSHTHTQYVSLIALTRFAIQSLYAPERLIDQSIPAHRTPMFTSHSISLFMDGSVMAMPLESWRAGNLYVTCVLLKNPQNQPVDLDARVIAGNWLSASFYPSNHLSQSGTKTDRTTVFLTSTAPFNDAYHQIKDYNYGN